MTEKYEYHQSLIGEFLKIIYRTVGGGYFQKQKWFSHQQNPPQHCEKSQNLETWKAVYNLQAVQGMEESSSMKA